jgi:hypothetical protein
LRSVPIGAFVDVTYTVSVAFELVLVASTLNCPLEYSARCTATVSAEADVVTFKVAVLVTPP